MKDLFLKLFAPAGDRAEEFAAPAIAAFEQDAALLHEMIKGELSEKLQAKMPGQVAQVVTAVARGVVGYLHMAEYGKQLAAAQQAQQQMMQLIVQDEASEPPSQEQEPSEVADSHGS